MKISNKKDYENSQNLSTESLIPVNPSDLSTRSKSFGNFLKFSSLQTVSNIIRSKSFSDSRGFLVTEKKDNSATIFIEEPTAIAWSEYESIFSEYESDDQISLNSKDSNQALIEYNSDHEQTREERSKEKERVRRESEDISQKIYESDMKFLKKFSGISKKLDYNDPYLDLSASVLQEDDWIVLEVDDLSECVVENLP